MANETKKSCNEMEMANETKDNSECMVLVDRNVEVR